MDEAIQVEALNNLKNCGSLKQISNDGLGGNSTKNNLENFINDNTVLKGSQWDSVRSKISKYNGLLDKRAKVAATLSSAIDSAIKLLLDYLGDDLYLDASQLEEINETKKRCVDLISTLKDNLNSVNRIEVTDESGNIVTDELGNVKYKTEYVYSSSERDKFKNMISELHDVTIPELDNLIEKIKGLPTIYKKAESIVNEAYNEIVKFSSEVSSITPSAKVQFTI